MLALNGSDFLRVAIFSAALGFAIFCASYGVMVWRKRNKGRGSEPTWARRLSYAVVFLGLLGLATSWGFSELERREGIAGGNDLFVVHARRDNTSLRLTPRDEVGSGEVIAEFVPPANQTQLAVKDIQQAQAQVKKEAIRVKPLPIDQSLVQRESQIRTQITQGESFLLELQKSRIDLEKARSTLLTEWTREKGQIEGEIASAERLLTAAESQLEIARTALQQASESFRKQIITQPVYDSRRSSFINAEREVSHQQVALSSLRVRRDALEERFKQSDASLSQQLAQIAESAVKFSASLESQKAQLAETTRLLDEDRARAKESMERELQAAELETSIAAAEKERSIETTQLKAPFSGRVVFRHPTPGLAADGAPVLALSAGTGFLSRVRLPQAEVDELAAYGQPVPLVLEHSALHNIITATFTKAEPLPLEKNQAIALFDCALPAEVVAGLGNSAEPIKVRLLWKPSLMKKTGFQASAALALLGVLGVMFTRNRQEAQAEQVSENVSSTAGTSKIAQGEASPATAESQGATSEIVDIRSRRTLVQHRGELVPKDTLTGLIDRNQFLTIAEGEVKRSAEAGTPLAVLLVGIDQLRETNTVYGRKAGDAILKDLADLCRGSRERDVTARWTGEEFVVLLPETDRAGAAVVADRLCLGAKQLRVRELPHLQSSVSVGVAEVLAGETTVLPALQRAAQQRDAHDADGGGVESASITA